MVRMRDRSLAGVIAVGMIAAAGCGGPAGKPKAASRPPVAKSAAPASAASAAATAAASGKPAEAPPHGYQWAGSSQAVWLAVPDSWVALNLAQVSLSQAAKRFAVKGTSLNASALKADVKALKQQHGFLVEDLESVPRSATHFAVNVNGFCQATPIQLIGSSAAPLVSGLRAEYAQLNASHLVISPTTVDGDPAVRAEYMLATTEGTITELQFSILTKASRLCTVTMTTHDPATSIRTFDTIASTIHAS